MNKPNISDIRNCYGCGVCSKPCPVHIIDLRLNIEGFYEPYLTDADKCIHCGLCRDVCAFIKDDLAVTNNVVSSYAGWSKDSQVRQKCSSGGVGMEIARYLLSQGYKTIGVRYNPETQRAEHFVADTIEKIIQTTGSKYIQSYPVDGWKVIDRKGKYLITGTPCQIDSFRNYMKRMRLPEENFVLLDFFCHGVPSMLVWNKYRREAERQLGPLTYASWRNKFGFGWHDSWIMGLDGEKASKPVDLNDGYDKLIKERYTATKERYTQGDPFFRLFLGDQCLGRHCYHDCKYKYDQSSADIRICDLWGPTYKNDEKGVTGTVAFTKRGDEILQQISCTLKPEPFKVVGEGQMKTCPPMLPLRAKLMASLQDKKQPLSVAIAIMDAYNRRQSNLIRMKHPLRSLYHLLKRIRKHL